MVSQPLPRGRLLARAHRAPLGEARRNGQRGSAPDGNDSRGRRQGRPLTARARNHHLPRSGHDQQGNSHSSLYLHQHGHHAPQEHRPQIANPFRGGPHDLRYCESLGGLRASKKFILSGHAMYRTLLVWLRGNGYQKEVCTNSTNFRQSPSHTLERATCGFIFFENNAKKCNYLIIKRLFGLLENWVTR